MKPIEFKQTDYPDISVEFNEPDIICLWQVGKTESNIVMIEKDKVQDLIRALISAQNGRFIVPPPSRFEPNI
jgi:hypothetical protein